MAAPDNISIGMDFSIFRKKNPLVQNNQHYGICIVNDILLLYDLDMYNETPVTACAAIIQWKR